MSKKLSTALVTALAVGIGSQFAMAPAQADGFNPMNMMNPGKWFGGKNRDYDDDYPPPPPPGVGGPYGPPPPGPGYGYGAPPAGVAPVGAPVAPVPGAYGTPPTAGYGAPVASGAYGAPPAPGYGAPAAPTYGAQSSEEPSRQEMEGRIQELEQRLQEMEAKNQATVPAPQPTTPPPNSYQYYQGDQTPSASQYPFRPMDLGR